MASKRFVPRSDLTNQVATRDYEMYRLPYSLLLVLAVLIGGCKPESKPTVFESKHDEHEQHSHDRGKMMLADFGAYHAGLTAHHSSKEGNELDIVVETDE